MLGRPDQYGVRVVERGREGVLGRRAVADGDHHRPERSATPAAQGCSVSRTARAGRSASRPTAGRPPDCWTGCHRRRGRRRAVWADPGLVELVVSADGDGAGLAGALRLLGFAADVPLRVVAVRSRIPLDRLGALVCPARPVKATPLADVGVLLAAAVDPSLFPPGVRAGIGSARSPERAWREPRTALCCTGPREPVVRYEDLGALALPAETPQDASRGNADVAAVARIALTAWRLLDATTTGPLR
ncbi:hypothetical protein ACODT3_38305 [Streptomyces sp. 4.24]|uniref:hypothetical protein n=1 Tax=Streptomyces tritrimontium TaxID=3406573 RepID=UPI003BB4E4D8